MNRSLKILFLLLALGQLQAQSYHFQQLSVGEGLPQSQVYAVLHDSRGYLWLGTQGGGLARFDGKVFQNFSVSDGLPGNYVNAIAEDKQGDLWIGTNNGACRYDGCEFYTFQYETGRPPLVNDLAIGQMGAAKAWEDCYLATEEGVFHLINDTFFVSKKQEAEPFGRMTAALIDSEGRVWMGGDEGIFRLGQKSPWTSIFKRKAEVLDFNEAPDGRVLAAVYGVGVFGFENKKDGRGTFLFDQKMLPSLRVQCLWSGPPGEIWVGTQDAGAILLSGLDSLGKNSLQSIQLAERQGLCNKNVRSIAGDRWGNVWFGTSGSGVCRYGGQEFEHLTQREGLRSNFVYSMATDTSGALWLSAGDRGVSFRQGDSLLHFGADNGFYDFKCRAMLRDSKGRIWIGTDGAGIATPLDLADSTGRKKFRLINRRMGLAGNWIRDIAEDAAGNLWVATTDGAVGQLTVRDLASGSFVFKNYGAENGLPVSTINQLHFDKTGQLWMASERQGLFFKLAGNESIGRYKMPAVTVRCMTEDSLGNLWFGTAGQGIGRFAIYQKEYNAPRMFGISEGLVSGNVYLLQFDPQGQLWVGTERGVDRISLDASGNPVEVRHFGLLEGFRGVEVCQNASLLDGQGNLWFGTVNGLTRYRISQADTGRTLPPKVHFTQVNLFYEPLANSGFAQFSTPWGGLVDGAVFPHDHNHLGFEFFAPNFSNPDRVTYSWQLVGQEAGWSPFAKRNEVSYANLPPGEYRFQVRARNEEGAIGEAVSVAFEIEAPYWQTGWFRGLMAGAMLVLVSGVFWLRVRRLRKRSEEERQRLEMENHLLQLEQKARQLQMNPHFIFNALNSIQSLVTRGENDRARQYILQFGRLMRAVLDNSRQALIPLNKEVDTLCNYLELEQFCRDGKFDFSIRTDGLASDDWQLPPMLLQPFVENAILHGVAPLKERQGLIDIVFLENENLLSVEILDNGVGFRNREERADGRTSAGIAVTRERVALLGGRLEIGAGDEGGTRVVLEIPLDR